MHYQPLPLRRALLATLVAGIAHGTAIAQEPSIPTITVTAPPQEERQQLNASALVEETLQTRVIGVIGVIGGNRAR
jgi:hypothetical protein